MEYLNAVLDEVECYPADNAALIVSLDRRMNHEVAQGCVSIAVQLKSAGWRIVGIDPYGDPLFSFLSYRACVAGLWCHTGRGYGWVVFLLSSLSH